MKKKFLNIRISEEDRERIKNKADAAHMNQTQYVLASCLDKNIVIIDGLKDVLKELRAIGNNLNQLVMLAHMGKVTVINLTEVRQVLAEIHKTLRELANRKRW